jgi:glycine amidinotransferase
VFDAADFVRCGCDLFVMRSNVTNALGIEWLRRHLGPTYRIHQIESRCPNPMHIDTTILPLRPGKLLVNSEYIDTGRLPDILKKWDILVAPEPDPIDDWMLQITSMCGKWLRMNVLMIDEKRVIVDPHHSGMMRALEKWGFLQVLHYAAFGGDPVYDCQGPQLRPRSQ